MTIEFQPAKMHSPLPGICCVGIAFTLIANYAFRHGFNFVAPAMAANTGIVLILATLAALSLSEAKARAGNAWTAKTIRNYNRTAMVVCHMAIFGLLACALIAIAAGVASTGEVGIGAILGALGIVALGMAFFTYLQGPRDPYEH